MSLINIEHNRPDEAIIESLVHSKYKFPYSFFVQMRVLAAVRYFFFALADIALAGTGLTAALSVGLPLQEPLQTSPVAKISANSFH